MRQRCRTLTVRRREGLRFCTSGARSSSRLHTTRLLHLPCQTCRLSNPPATVSQRSPKGASRMDLLLAFLANSCLRSNNRTMTLINNKAISSSEVHMYNHHLRRSTFLGGRWTMRGRCRIVKAFRSSHDLREMASRREDLCRSTCARRWIADTRMRL